MPHRRGSAVPVRAGGVLTAALATIAVLAASLVLTAGPAGASPEHELLAALNRHRSAAGLAPLQLQGDIHGYARRHAADMAAAGRIWHGNVSAHAPAGWRRLGEAVASAETVQGLADAIMGSPSHRALVLDRGFQWAGSGVAAGHGRLYAAVPLMDHPDPNGTGGQQAAPPPTTQAPPPPPPAPSASPAPPPAPAPSPPAAAPPARRPAGGGPDAGRTLTAAPEGPPAGVGTAGPPAVPTPPPAVARSLDGLRHLDRPAEPAALRATAYLSSVLCRRCGAGVEPRRGPAPGATLVAPASLAVQVGLVQPAGVPAPRSGVSDRRR